MSEAAFDADVVIVGGGPVGIGLAIDLGQRGVRTIVVERYPELQPVPKGQNLTQRTMEHFQVWGIEDEVRAARTVRSDYGIGGLTTYRTLISDYTHDWLQRELVRPFYHADNERLPQYQTEAVLRKRVAELDCVEVIYGYKADDVRQDADGVEVSLSERKGDGTRTIRARYAVGCDGAKSVVRETGGITQTRSALVRLMVLLVFRSTELHELLKRYPGKSFYNVLHPDLKGYWLFFGRVDLGTTWFFHAPVPADTTKDNFDFTAYLHRAAGAEFAVEYDHIGFWDLRFSLADSYRNGRIFVAGDAAHSHPPYGGYGVNSGLEDARNLGWKLAAVLQGWGGEALLDSYDLERRPTFASTAGDFIEKAIFTDRDFLDTYDPAVDREAFEREWTKRGSGAQSEVNAFEPHYGASPVVTGAAGDDTSSVGKHTFDARPGHHLAPAMLSTGHNVFEALGGGFTLLAFGADDASVAAVEAAADAGGVSLTVVRDQAGGEPDRYEAKLVLVRPDHFVAWAGDEAPADAAGLLQKVCGAASTG